MLTPEQEQVALSDPAHLKRWLEESGRAFLIFDKEDLVGALRAHAGRFITFVSADLVDAAWGPGLVVFQSIVEAYAEHRRTHPTGRVELQTDPDTGYKVEVPVMKGEVLELDEMKDAVRWLVECIREKEPSWAP